MRDYMRRKRAAQRAKAPGLTTRPVKPSAEPDAAKDQEIAVVGHLPLFMRNPADLKRGQAMVAHGEEFVGGLFGGLNPARIA